MKITLWYVAASDGMDAPAGGIFGTEREAYEYLVRQACPLDDEHDDALEALLQAGDFAALDYYIEVAQIHDPRPISYSVVPWVIEHSADSVATTPLHLTLPPHRIPS